MMVIFLWLKIKWYDPCLYMPSIKFANRMAKCLFIIWLSSLVGDKLWPYDKYLVCLVCYVAIGCFLSHVCLVFMIVLVDDCWLWVCILFDFCIWPHLLILGRMKITTYETNYMGVYHYVLRLINGHIMHAHTNTWQCITHLVIMVMSDDISTALLNIKFLR